MQKFEPRIAAAGGWRRAPIPAEPAQSADRAAWFVGSTKSSPPDCYDDPVVRSLMRELGVSWKIFELAREEAARNTTLIGEELLAAGAFRASDFARAAARVIGVAQEDPASGDVPIGKAEGADGMLAHSLRTCDRFFVTKLFLDPSIEWLSAIVRFVSENPSARRRMRITTRKALAAKRIADGKTQLFEKATLSLSAEHLHHSARIVLTGWQGAFLGCALTVLLAIAATGFLPLMFAVHIGAACFFSLWVTIRFVAAFKGRPPPAVSTFADPFEAIPVYTVVVALNREHEVVEQLVAGLDALDWPKSRLEIFLVCEEDDPGTIAPCRTFTEGKPQYTVVTVPPGEPRTKPKALNFVLPVARGEFLVLYDAEDRPRRDQLREAFRRYRLAAPNVACLQAPLVIRNAGRNWLTVMFALEYAALFRAFLPWLARHRLPIPLGGTSNHFRTDILRSVGGWDSHNVTEDADLGLRLKRAGYDVGVLVSPTYEDAPETLWIWIKQRTRWLKGWMQTYAVHMRNPGKLYRELGGHRFAMFQLIFHGMFGASLLLPFALLMAGATVYMLAFGSSAEPFSTIMIQIDLAIFAGGLASFAALSFRGADRRERRRILGVLPTVPLYWLLVSFAAYRGLLQLFGNASAWEKTPHGLASRKDKHDLRYRIEPVLDVD